MTMNPQNDVADLMEHIRHHAAETSLVQVNTNGVPPPEMEDGWPQINAAAVSPPPPAPAFGAFPASDPVPLAEVAGLVPRAREKLTVRPGIPGVLRPLFRNQGGFNGILLQTCDRLVEIGAQFQQENVDLRARVDALTAHQAGQTLWLDGLARASAESQRWMRFAQTQFQRLESQYEARCHRMEVRLDQAEGLLQSLQEEANEQGVTLLRLETQLEQQQAWMQNFQVAADEEAGGGAESKTADEHAGGQSARLDLEKAVSPHHLPEETESGVATGSCS